LTGDVQLPDDEPRPLFPRGRFERPRLGEVAHGGDHGVAVLGQVERGGEADAGAGPGDERDGDGRHAASEARVASSGRYGPAGTAILKET